jgi:hypothetical protein
VLEFLDLMLLASLERRALQITKKVYRIKDSYFFYYIIGTHDKKLGYRILAVNEWFDNFM